ACPQPTSPPPAIPSMALPTPRPSTTPFPYTTLFRSQAGGGQAARARARGRRLCPAHDRHRHQYRSLPADRARAPDHAADPGGARSEEHTSELQSHLKLVCRLLLETKQITACLMKVHV